MMTDPAAPDNGEPLAYALATAACGLRVLPIKPGAKYPPMNSWQHAATTDTKVITNWYHGLYANHGVGIAMGPQPDGRQLFALDIDEHNPATSGSDTITQLEAAHGKLPDTVRSITGAGGVHMIFDAGQTEVTNGAAGQVGLGVDVRGTGGQIVVAPTTHPNGTVYSWETGYAPWEHQIAHAPAWLIELVAPQPVPIAPEPKPSTPPSGDSPADLLRASWDWRTELYDRGWTLHHADRSGDTHWTRPGKDPRHGTSGVLHTDGPFVVFTTDATTQTMWHAGKISADGSCVSLSPLAYIAAYDHNGDLAAAGKALRAASNPPIAVTVLASSPPTDDESDWAPINLAGIATAMRTGDYQQITPSALAVEGSTPLFYAERINSLFGESGGGKTWVALAAVAEVVRAGDRALLIDYEDTPAGIAERLVLMGLTDDEINRVDYRNPTTGLGFGLEHIARHLDKARYALVVLDSTGEAMASGAVNPNADEEVAMWFRRVKELMRLPGGPAVVVLDHVPKDKDAPSSYAIGSQRKRAAVTGAAYRVDTLKEPAKGRSGKLRLTVAKDRPGNRAKGTTASIVDIESLDDGKVAMRFHLSDAQVAKESGERWRPTIYMERISDWLHFNPDASKRAVIAGVTGKRDTIQTALEVLVDEGWVALTDGVRGAKICTLQRRYHESADLLLVVDNSDDDPPVHRGPTAAPPRPDTGASDPCTAAPPLLRGRGAGAAVEPQPVDNSDSTRAPSEPDPRLDFDPFN